MPINFNCPGCGKGYSVPDGVAGKATKCRACGAAITIPMGNEAPIAAAPMAPFAPSAGEPARSGRGLPIKKLGMIAAAALVVILLGYTAYALLGSSSPAGITYMPDKTAFLASVRVADFMKSGVWADVKKDFPDVDTMLTQNMKDAPFQLEDIAQILVGVGDPSKQEVVVAVEFKKSVKLDDIVAFINKQTRSTKQLTESKIGSYTVKGDNEGTLCQINNNLIIGGTPAAVKAVLERDKKPGFSEGMQKALKDADLSQVVSLAVDIKGFANDPTVGGLAKQQGVDVASVESSVVNIAVGSDVKVNAITVCKDAKVADEYRKMAEGGLVMVKKMAGDQMPKELAEIIDGVKIVQKDNRLTAEVTIKVSPVIKAAKPLIGVEAKQEFKTVGKEIRVP